MILQKIEEAIQLLDEHRHSIQGDIEAWGWIDDRGTEPIDAHTRLMLDQVDLVESVPERRPLPPGIMGEYQQWYSASRVILEKHQEGRLREFDSLYSEVRQRLEGRHVSRHEQFGVLDFIDQQFYILCGVVSHVRFSAYDVELTAYSLVMDDELGAARHLLTRGFLRSAGALAGVLLERHLKKLLERHTPPIRYSQRANLSQLNDKCKDVAYDLVMWRKVQHLIDVRNLCDHDRVREPTRDEVEGMLRGVAEVVHTASPGAR